MEKFTQLQVQEINVAIVDPSGVIVAVNEAWKNFGRRNRLPGENFGVGLIYSDYCMFDDPHMALQFKDKLRDLIAGRVQLVTEVYPCHSPTEKQCCHLIGMPLSLDKATGTAVMHTNLTEFLPPPMDARGEPSDTTDAGQVEPTKIVRTIAESIEGSIAEALSSQLVSMLTFDHQAPSHKDTPGKSDADESLAYIRLSKSQVQVLGLLGKGKSDEEIAEALRRSPYTIKVHVAAIVRQLNVASRTEAALVASRMLEEIFRRYGL